MASFTYSPRKYFFTLGSIILSLVALVYAKGFLIPFCFSILIAFILVPYVRWLENKKIPSAIAIVLVFIAVIGIIFGISYFFGSQITNLISDFNSFREDAQKILDQGVQKYNNTFTFLPPIDKEIVKEKTMNFFQNSGGSIVSNTVVQTSSFLANAFLVPVYVFLLLMYRRGIKTGITFFFRPEKREKVEEVLYDVQSVGKNYIIGLFTVMLILGIANSAMLMIVGIDYAIMFGCLAALLIVIPYIGTYLGAALPVLYALVTMDVTSALVILISFVVIQALEGNVLTPKIVGSNTNVNALTAFIALIAGGYIWGIAGMVLSIPFIAMLKKVFRYISGLQPLALLMGEELYEDEIVVPKEKLANHPHPSDLIVEKLDKEEDEDNKKPSKISKLWNIWFGKKREEIDDSSEADDNESNAKIYKD